MVVVTSGREGLGQKEKNHLQTRTDHEMAQSLHAFSSLNQHAKDREHTRKSSQKASTLLLTCIFIRSDQKGPCNALYHRVPQASLANHASSIDPSKRLYLVAIRKTRFPGTLRTSLLRPDRDGLLAPKYDLIVACI